MSRASSRNQQNRIARSAVWDIHERPNLFGLRIAMNPHPVDLVADGPHALGGDGGCNICGGAGFFLGWLPLATAFRGPTPSGWRSQGWSDANVSCVRHRMS
jgi:hypothetical protein